MINPVHKLCTFARLIRRGDTMALRRRARYNSLLWKTWLHGGSPFVFRKDGIRYACHPDRSDSRVVSALDATDILELAVLRRWLQRGDWFVDGGAHLGVYTAAAAQFVGRDGLVTAIDAGKGMIDLLKQSMDVLGHRHVACVHAALGDHDGEVTFFEARSGEPTFSQSLLVEPGCAGAFVARQVRMTTLSSLTASSSGAAPAAVKIDVEGAEVLTLTGVPSAWLSGNGPLWIIEINASALKRFGRTPQDVVRHFDDSAFEKWIVPKELRDPAGNKAVRRLEQGESWIDSVYYNLIAIPGGNAHRKRRGRIAGQFAP